MFGIFYLPMTMVVAAVLYVLQQLAMRVILTNTDPVIWSKLQHTGLASSGPWRWPRALIASISSSRRYTTEGYERIGKALQRPFALPTTWSGRSLMVLPPSMLHQMLTRPDKLPNSEITNIFGLIETIQLPYIISDPDIYLNALHFDVVRRKMAQRHMPRFAAITADEIDRAFGDIWGTSREWTTINGWNSCGRIIARTAQRIMIGLPMGRDERLLEVSRLYAEAVLLGGAVMNCFPPLLRRVVGPLIALRAKYYQKRCTQILVSIIEERMRMQQEPLHEQVLPDDFLQWLIATCEKDGPHQMHADRIANRLIALMTPLIFAVCYVFAHAVLDLYGSADKEAFLRALESECRSVAALHDGLATAEAVATLYRVDSAIRESMRKSDVSIYSLYRDVTSGELDIGSNLVVPQGVRMVFPTQNIHLDASNYHDPLRYDPFRFSREFEDQDEDQAKMAEAERKLITTPTLSFLPLGYGRHACPGRWFAAQTMKQALAYIVMNYEVELIGKPIRRRALLNTMVPPVDAKIRIRRKPQIINMSAADGRLGH